MHKCHDLNPALSRAILRYGRMANESNAQALDALDERHRRSWVDFGTLSSYWILAKPDVNLLVVVTVFVAFCLATPLHSHPFPFARLINTLTGTFLVAAGSGALNQYLERRFDAQMRRTLRRPLVAGKLEPIEALCFGLLILLAGSIYLAVAVNQLSGCLAASTAVIYLFIYTPLKRITPLCTWAGAVPGAAPPLIGWAGACGHLSSEAWILYALLFLWQFPHFMAIAWMYREDYRKAGYLVLPGEAAKHRVMAWQILVPSIVLIPVSLLSRWWHFDGWICSIGALLATLFLLYFGMQLTYQKTNAAAHRLLFASLLYLPCVLVLMMVDRV
jgi:protoheme IX farnesyltransferase